MTENFAVYTLRNADEAQDVMLLQGGRAAFLENKRWTAVEKWLRQDTVERKRIPLLLGNASSIIGVEWVAWITDIRIQDEQTTVEYEGLRCLERPIPLDALNLASSGKPLSAGYIKTYVPCNLQPKVMKVVRDALTRADSDSRDALSLTEPFAAQAARLELAEDPKFRDADATTRSQLVEARIGQGDYRKRLLSLWDNRCAVTGVGISAALIASHIKPWADSSNAERLDKFNGLILSASIDRLFDQGLISFDDTGQIIANEAMDAGELLKLGITGAAKLRFVRKEHKPYLAYHRKRYRGA